MPYTAEQLLSAFERYNRAIEPAPFFAYALGAVALVFACRGGPASGRAVLAILALFWTASAGAQLAYFGHLAPSAFAFGALFLLEAVLLAAAAFRREVPAFRLRWSVRCIAALALAAYALAAYPRVGAAVGHGYPRGPVVGVAACPTTIFTVAVLLLAERPTPALLAVPLLWSLVGFPAAVQLGMIEDYGLAAAAAAAVFAALEARRGRAARAVKPTPVPR